MKTLLKFVVLPLAGIIVIMVAIGAYIAATFDPNQYKPQIIQAVKDKVQRTLRLDGDIKLSLFPNVGVTLGKATLSEHAGNREFAGVDDLRVALKLLPLLSKEIVVDTVEVKNLRANLVRHKDGKTNIDDFTTGSAKSAPDAMGEGPQIRIDIDHVSVLNAAITYADESAGTQYALSNLHLKTGRIASGVPSKFDLAFTAQSGKPSLNIDATLSTTITFDLEKRHYGLAGLDFSAKGTAPGINGLIATAKGDIDANLATSEFLLSKFAVTATGKQEGGDLKFKFDVPKLNIAKEKVRGEHIALEATLTDAKGKVTAKIDIPGLGGNMNRVELAKLVATVNINNPKLPKNPIDATINGSAAVDLAKQNASIAFTTRFDDSNISGKAGLSKFSPPFYTFDINIDQLDADRYLPKSDPKPKQPEQPLDLSALKDLNANGSIKVGSLKVANVKAANVRVDVRAAAGRLDVSPIAANLYQGSLTGMLSVQAAATPVITVKQTLNGINVGALLKDAANFGSLEGKGNLTLDVSGQGQDVSSIKKSLNGNAAIRLTDGAIKGINIAGSIRDAKAKLGALQGDKTQAANQTEKTDFSELSATFNIKGGVAHNGDLSGKSPLLRLGGEGDIDIGNERLDYLVKATVVATAAGQGGKEFAQLSGVTVPVRLSGPFAAPQYKIDFAGIAAGAAKAVVESKKEEIKAKAQDQLKNQLKGLLGR